jgi:hypothetical protein
MAVPSRSPGDRNLQTWTADVAEKIRNALEHLSSSQPGAPALNPPFGAAPGATTMAGGSEKAVESVLAALRLERCMDAKWHEAALKRHVGSLLSALKGKSLTKNTTLNEHNCEKGRLDCWRHTGERLPHAPPPPGKVSAYFQSACWTNVHKQAHTRHTLGHKYMWEQAGAPCIVRSFAIAHCCTGLVLSLILPTGLIDASSPLSHTPTDGLLHTLAAKLVDLVNVCTPSSVDVKGLVERADKAWQDRVLQQPLSIATPATDGLSWQDAQVGQATES